ncbi:MAG: uncharacterized protein KVP18_004139 [Porospora cf. gigantea A]|uniref:uncharacterized protein n=1 Tax=Porospora cf. gigantea A TaxID=2853593 RepID=UPI00355AA4B1|nr:MAG: hypothetical protein KVP18_004139 [Porospora cf. gigantea A]
MFWTTARTNWGEGDLADLFGPTRDSGALEAMVAEEKPVEAFLEADVLSEHEIKFNTKLKEYMCREASLTGLLEFIIREQSTSVAERSSLFTKRTLFDRPVEPATPSLTPVVPWSLVQDSAFHLDADQKRRFHYPLVVQKLLCSSNTLQVAIAFCPVAMATLFDFFKTDEELSPVLAGYVCAVLQAVVSCKREVVTDIMWADEFVRYHLMRHVYNRSVTELLKTILIPEKMCDYSAAAIAADDTMQALLQYYEGSATVHDHLVLDAQENAVYLIREMLVSSTCSFWPDYISYLVQESVVARIIDAMFTMDPMIVTGGCQLLVEILVQLDVYSINSGREASDTQSDFGDPPSSRGIVHPSRLVSPAEFVDSCIGPFFSRILNYLLRPFVVAALTFRERRRRKSETAAAADPSLARTPLTPGQEKLLVVLPQDGYTWFTGLQVSPCSGLTVVQLSNGSNPVVGHVLLELLTLIRALMRVYGASTFDEVQGTVLEYAVILLSCHRWCSSLHIAVGDIILTSLQRQGTVALRAPELLITRTSFVQEATVIIRRHLKLRGKKDIVQRQEERAKSKTAALSIVVEILKVLSETVRGRHELREPLLRVCPEWDQLIAPELRQIHEERSVPCGGLPPSAMSEPYGLQSDDDEIVRLNLKEDSTMQRWLASKGQDEDTTSIIFEDIVIPTTS